MSRIVRKQLFSILDTLSKATGLVNKLVINGDVEEAEPLLAECQKCAITIGTRIDRVYGEDTASVHALEVYCEWIYQMAENLHSDTERRELCVRIEEQIDLIRNAMEIELPDRVEMVFLPYKASMWDSLESVYTAAKEDGDCDVYCVPIPYFEKNKDGSLGQMYYEGEEYPKDVTITDWQAYDFGVRRPDVVFIHNPYDEYNFVTSVHPFYYSKNLKQYTDTLVYIPYYSTSGGMSEAQRLCSAYLYADYIVIQAEKYREFIDPAIPREKLLPFGSPKFDRVIRKCMNPPEPPAEWKKKMQGKKVYFYNTSLNGMLENTKAFLEKMVYVFRCFEGREDACLLWRPHPLMESTFASMRTEEKPIYDKLKNYFIASDLGIYDDTPDISDTIALCDAYIGDSGTSVISLFGIAGKPIFVLDNNIHTPPKEEDWRGQIIMPPALYGDNAWMVTQGNKLYHSPNRDYQFKFFCDLNECTSGNYYFRVITINNKHYVCPYSAQNILILGEQGIERKIELKREIESAYAFKGAVSFGKYLFLIPNYYPAIVRYDTENDEISYYKENVNVFVNESNGIRRVGGHCVQDGYLFIVSPVNDQVLVHKITTGEEWVMELQTKQANGYVSLQSDGESLWFLPYEGNTVLNWKPFTKDVKEYDTSLSGMKCYDIRGNETKECPFMRAMFDRQYVYLAPYWANMGVCLNKDTGEITEWNPGFEKRKDTKNGYYKKGAKSDFISQNSFVSINSTYRLFSTWDKKIYEGNFEDGKWRELPIVFDKKELEANEAGFAENSEWLPYICEENAFNSLTDFLDGNITGNSYKREIQLHSFEKMAANCDGTSGEKIYVYIKEHAKRG